MMYNRSEDGLRVADVYSRIRVKDLRDYYWFGNRLYELNDEYSFEIYITTIITNQIYGPIDGYQGWSYIRNSRRVPNINDCDGDPGAFIDILLLRLFSIGEAFDIDEFM